MVKHSQMKIFDEMGESKLQMLWHLSKERQKCYLCKNMKFLPLVCDKLVNMYFGVIWTKGNHWKKEKKVEIQVKIPPDKARTFIKLQNDNSCEILVLLEGNAWGFVIPSRLYQLLQYYFVFQRSIEGTTYTTTQQLASSRNTHGRTIFRSTGARAR